MRSAYLCLQIRETASMDLQTDNIDFRSRQRGQTLFPQQADMCLGWARGR